MKFLLDTDCCIYLLTGLFPVLTARVERCETGSVAISAITFAEIAHGSANARMPPPELLDDFLSEIILLPFDEAAARSYARLPFRRGRFDRLIGAHALALDLTLVTNNVRDFADIPGLRVENWTS